MESNFPATLLKTVDEAEVLGRSFCENENINCYDKATNQCDVDCMRGKSSTQVEQAWRDSEGSFPVWIIDNYDHLLDGILGYSPIVDGIEIPGQIIDLLRAGKFDPSINVMFGTNTGEGQTFVYYIPIPITYRDYEYAVEVIYYPNGQRVIDYYSQFFHPLEDGRIPMSQVITDYLFRCSSEVYGTEIIKRGGKAWVYQFDHVYSSAFLFPMFGLPDICENVTCHAAEIPFVFNNTVPSLNATFTDEEITLVKRMDSYWTSFVRTGNPNTNGDQLFWPLWDGATRPTLRIQTPDVLVEYDSVQLCENFWDSMG